jgi:uncharacterized protein YndB with AHSA1/START domain
VAVVTVRRWIDAPPREVWKRLVDLDGLVVRDPELDLVDLAGDGRLHRGTTAVLSRRRGARHVTFELTAVAVEDPYRLVLSLTTHRTRWTVRIELTPCSGEATDVHVHAELDPSTSRRLGMRSLGGGSEPAAAKDVTSLLGAMMRRAAAEPVRR